MAAPSTAPKEPYFPEPLISRKNFEDWGRACRVRAIQDKYNEMLENAIQENLSLDQYIKKNFQDHTAFLLTCPQFNLFCWPAALAELGSGVVLYFHFLIFLGCFLFIAFLVQLPAIMEYWGKDNLKMWQERAGGATVMSSAFIYTSPGMLGPRMSESGQVPFCYFVLVCLLCGLVVAKSAWQLRVDHTVDQGTTQPNDFAIMVEDLPPSATDEQAIMDFFKAHAVRGQDKTEIAKVVIGWDAAEYREKMAEMGKMQKELKTLPPDDPKVKDLMESMTKINADLMSTANDTASRLASSGVVVVSFRYQTDLRRCLDRWQSLWATWGYRDWGGCCGIFGGAPLPKFPTASGIGVWKIKVKRAPNPGDINGDDLGVPKNERLKRLVQTNIAMLLIIGMSFAVCYAMITVKDSADSQWLGILPAFGICAANVGVVFASKYFGEKEYHNTVTGQTGSQALKMSLGMIVNTAVVMLAINPKEDEWYKKSGLASDIMTLIAFTAVLQPMFQLLDLKYAIKYFSRGKIKEDQLQRLRDGAAWYNSNAVTKETANDFKSFRAEYKQTVEFFNSAFEPSDMDMKRRYAYAVRTFVCCMCYCHLVPFICLVGIAGIVVQYWVDKKMLLRWYKRSAIPQGMDQARMSLYFLRFTTLLMPLCMWFFISPSYKKHNTIIYWMALSYGPAAALCILPLQAIRRIICAPCRGWGQARVASDETEDYYTAQHMWPRELKYHKSHRLYLGLPEAKNPEMLDPSLSSVTKAEDVKASYGASAVSAAAAPKVVLAGGDALGGAAPAGPAAVVEPAAGVTPTMIGATDGPSAGDVAAVTPLLSDPGVTPTIASAGGGTWEMEIGHGWSRFDDDCHDHLESQYQKFANKGGQSRITVRTKGMSLSVDFEKMSQMRLGKGKNKVHNIRRSEGP